VRNRQLELIAVSDTLGILSGILVIVRFASKLLWLKTPITADDWAVLAVAIIGAPVTAINVYGTTANGLGRDIWTLTSDQITRFGMSFYVAEVIYFVEVPAVKLSLLLFYLRIFPTKLVRRLLWATVAFNVVYGVAFTFLGIFQCTPISYFWTRWDTEHEGKCLNINIVVLTNAAISIALDIWMLAIPLSQLRSLNLHWKKKIGVAVMFCVGTL